MSHNRLIKKRYNLPVFGMSKTVAGNFYSMSLEYLYLKFHDDNLSLTPQEEKKSQADS